MSAPTPAVLPSDITLEEAEHLAAYFHASYESLAPLFGYQTREDSSVAWEDVPEQNRRLMVETCRHVVAALRSGLLPVDVLPVHPCTCDRYAVKHALLCEDCGGKV